MKTLPRHIAHSLPLGIVTIILAAIFLPTFNQNTVYAEFPKAKPATNTPTVIILPTETPTPSESPIPSPTDTPDITLTPSESFTPSITLLPTETFAPTETLTPTIMPTPTNTLEPYVFSDGFESGDLLAWDNAVTGGGNLSISSSKVTEGIYSLAANLNGTTKMYVEDLLPSNETYYRARFYVKTDQLFGKEGATAKIFESSPFALQVKFINGGYSLQAEIVDDNGIIQLSPWIDITSGWHYFEIEWKASISDGVNDGGFSVWVDDDLKWIASAVDNDTLQVSFVRLGITKTLSSPTGVIYFDAFYSGNLPMIGPDPNAIVDPTIFSDNFEGGDLTAWSAVNTGNGKIAIDPTYGIDTYSLLAYMYANRGDYYIEDQTPSNEKFYRVRFYFKAENNYTFGSQGYATIFEGLNAFGVDLLNGRSLRGYILDDGNNRIVTSSSSFDAKSWHSLEIEWKASAAQATADGYLNLWIDDTLVATVSNLDNDTKKVNAVRLGVLKIPDGTSIRLNFDEFASSKGDHLGLIPGWPLMAPTPLKPISGGLEISDSPTFTWSTVPYATCYSVSFLNSGFYYSTRGERTVDCPTDFDSISCTNDICKFDGWYFSRYVEGEFSWGVTSYIDEISSPTIYTNFTKYKGPPISVSPDNEVFDSHYPTYTWNRVDIAPIYSIKIEEGTARNIKILTPAEAGCAEVSQSTCSYVHESSLFMLKHGINYSWSVAVSNGTETSAYSISKSFRIRPDTPQLISPKDGIDVVPRTPIFSWVADPEANYYILNISDSSNTVIKSQRYSVTANQYYPSPVCAEGHCSTVSPIALGPGVYSWTLTTGVNIYEGYPSSPQFFNILPVAFSFISPVGAIVEPQPQFQWNEIPQATSYTLYLSSSITNRVYWLNYRAADVCANGICSVSTAISLIPGEYAWYIQVAQGAIGIPYWSGDSPFTVLPGQ